ncbi:MAG: RluA family pseudouridine synthase [Candidatus Saccharicenans sp.]
MLEKKLIVEDEAGQRLDVYLKDKIKGFSRAQWQKAIKEGRITVNRQVVKPSYNLRKGDLIEIRTEEEGEESELVPEAVPYRVIFEDSQIIVVDKPAGVAVHPGAGLKRGTLVHGLLLNYPEIRMVGSPLRPGIVHRLDKDTSGLLVVARTNQAYLSLREQFEERSVSKTYLALALGRFREKKGTIDLPIGRHVHHREKISVKTRKPRLAVTHYQVLEEFRETTFLALKPVTGRTHQLRVHLSATGHPIAGDPKYGGLGEKGRKRWPRLFLHAWKLAFNHPLSGERMEFESPLPEELNKILEKERLLK